MGKWEKGKQKQILVLPFYSNGDIQRFTYLDSQQETNREKEREANDEMVPG